MRRVSYAEYRQKSTGCRGHSTCGGLEAGAGVERGSWEAGVTGVWWARGSRGGGDGGKARRARSRRPGWGRLSEWV